jgi:uncharacterized protein Smg (DUF494 family)
MISEIVDVLAQLVQRMNKASTKNDNEALLQKLYGKTIVAAAYSWIYEKNIREESNVEYSSSLRMLSENEIETIQVDNYNYLLHLYNIGLISCSEFNSIIEKLLFLTEDEITTDNINLFILALYLDTDDIALPGSRFLLNSSDTIN